MDRFIDLHTHTTASDGTFSPAGLVAHAAQLDLAAVAVTDHDTMAGTAEALEAGGRYGVEVVPGCEVSTDYHGLDMHVLGLWLPPEPKELTALFNRMNKGREGRNQAIVDKLNSQGIPVTMEEVLSLAGGTVGRPHLAQALVRHGAVGTINEAFDKYLGRGGLAYQGKTKKKAVEVVELLKREGATPILAHPGLLPLDFDDLKAAVLELKDHGLDGLEAYYSGHFRQQTERLLTLARVAGLAVSGGSDFHGEVKPGLELGTGHGSLAVPERVLAELKDLRARQGLPC